VIDIGKMRDRVTILASTSTRSASGQAKPVWDTTVATVWAEVKGLSTRDLMQAQQANVLATHRVRMRYRSDVKHTHRLQWDGRTLEISSVIEDPMKTVLTLLAREVQ
jgi:SPP1 family predicted phage head-tail adaptor